MIITYRKFLGIKFLTYTDYNGRYTKHIVIGNYEFRFKGARHVEKMQRKSQK